MKYLKSIKQAIIALIGLGLALSSVAQEYPNKPIKVIVPYAAGGTTDQVARAIQVPLSELLGQPVVIENKPGAGGTIGSDMVAKAPADGYTLLFGNTGPNVVVSLMRKTPYDIIKDFQPISTVIISPMMLAVPTDSPAKNFKEFLALAKQDGANMNYGSVGNGSLSHLTGEYFNTAAGLKLQHIPYNGGAPMLAGFVGGQLQSAFVTGLDGASMLATGKVKYLAIATEKQSDILPNVQAMGELIPGFKSSAWFGVLAPKGIPKDVLDKLNKAIVKVVARPDIQQLFKSKNVDPRSTSPEGMSKIIQEELRQWAPLVQKSKIEM